VTSFSDVWARCVQLINRANHWNLSGARVDEDELATAVGSGATVMVYGKVEDAISSYGIVAVALIDPGLREVSTMVVSCRVIGLGVDEALMATVLDAFGPVRLRAVATGRNLAAQDFMSRHRQVDGVLATCPPPRTLRCPAHWRATCRRRRSPSCRQQARGHHRSSHHSSMQLSALRQGVEQGGDEHLGVTRGPFGLLVAVGFFAVTHSFVGCGHRLQSELGASTGDRG
jgi:hypothetical protein